MSSVAYNKKYRSLFRKAKTRYKVITGGRGSGKSYAISSALVCDTYNDSYNTLFTRYTMVAAHDSIIPEFTDKIDLFRLENDFHITKRDVINTSSGAGILFRGLMVSSKNQVARLKSIAKVKRFIIDEAQELTDEELFDTIDFSIRTTEVDNEIWIIWNPPRDKNHWIYRRFFKDAGVDITHNGIVGDVEYIYTTYLDNLRNLDDSFIMQAQKMKEKDRDKYDNVFLGIPVGFKEGQIYRWTAMPESEWEPERVSLCYGVDWGYTNDQTAVVRVDYDKETNTVYLKEVMYEREMQPRDVARAIREDMERRGCGKSVLVYCDPARPEHIAELRRLNLNACKAVNKNKAGRINYLQGFTVFYDGEHIGEEADNYSFKPHPNDKTMFTNEPEDGKDHLMDAANYGAVTHLRRLGIANDDDMR
jgi:phage terminase large subunit